MENLLAAWKEFIRGKRKKRDVQEFQHALMDNVLTLHRELKEGTYKHGAYHAFKISDPKPRDIHKASVRDRLLHHALQRKLYLFFERTWIADSYSCRNRKGTHAGMNRFRTFARRLEKNKKTVWVLKCDIRKFFASIDQRILLDTVARYIPDERINALLAEVVGSFCSCCPTKNGLHLNYAIAHNKCMRKGLPLGNLTSQLLVNIYMNEIDQFVKHKLKAKYYIRYADDFVIVSHDSAWLESLLPRIAEFLEARFALSLHPKKVSITKFASGIDFLGWVHFPDYRVLRTSTKRRMLKRAYGLDEDDSVVQSYLGMLKHGNAQKLSKVISKPSMI